VLTMARSLQRAVAAALTVAAASCQSTSGVDSTPEEPTRETSRAAATVPSAPVEPVAPSPTASSKAVKKAAAGDEAPAADACSLQGGERLDVASRRAVGTEPFWAARIEGRCVTYSDPANQDGTRIWTQYRKEPGRETWTGTFGGKSFDLKVLQKAGCSDGMSDKRYAQTVHLSWGAASRDGCAEPVP
jgi:uncharacterized membrane protein